MLEQGKLETITPKAPVEEGKTIEVQLVEVGLHDSSSAVAKVEGFDVCVADAAKLVGKKVKVQIVRVLPDSAYATIVSGAKSARAPITAEGEAEKPTRKTVAKKDTLEPGPPKRRTTATSSRTRTTTSSRSATSWKKARPTRSSPTQPRLRSIPTALP